MTTREGEFAVGRKRLGRLPINTQCKGQEAKPHISENADTRNNGTSKQIGKPQLKQVASSFSLSLCSEFDTEMVDLIEQIEEATAIRHAFLDKGKKGQTVPKSQLKNTTNGGPQQTLQVKHKTSQKQDKKTPKSKKSNKNDVQPGKLPKRLSVSEDPNLSWASPQEASTPNRIPVKVASKCSKNTPQVQTQLFKSLFTIPSPMCGLEISPSLDVYSQKENSKGSVRNKRSRLCETPQKPHQGENTETVCSGEVTPREKKKSKTKETCKTYDIRRPKGDVQSMTVSKNDCQRISGKKRKSSDKLVLVEDSQSPEGEHNHAIKKLITDSKGAGIGSKERSGNVRPVLSSTNQNVAQSDSDSVNSNENRRDAKPRMPSASSSITGVESAVVKEKKTSEVKLNSAVVDDKNGSTAQMTQLHDQIQKEDLVDRTPDGHTDRLMLANWGLPDEVLQQYHKRGITTMFEWQAECLCTENVLAGGNLVYSAPTSAGKTMVAELLVLKRIVETKKKAIIILPFVSVTREKMLYLQELYQDAGIRVNGFMGSHSPPGGLNSVDVAVCTIEKGNGLINRMLEENSLDKLGIIVVDELHLVGDPHRGYLLELLLTKICYVIKKEQTQNKTNQKTEVAPNPIQIVGMSATLPNLDLLAGWLNAKMFVSNFRPVPLTETIKLGTAIYDSSMTKIRDIDLTLTFKGDDDHVIPLCLETLRNGHSVLIFCPSKNWCEKLCESIAREFYNILKNDKAVSNSTEVKPLPLNQAALSDVVEQLRRTPVGLDSTLGRTVYYGVAFHHAGLTFDERDIVEGGFRQGILKVLVATSTLSSGVNLPARRVIVRSPVVHAGKMIDFLTYKQMIGRAGRKGVDTEGESILICKATEKSKAMILVRSTLPPVNSCLLKHGSQLSSSLKRAILEIVVSGVATRPADVVNYISCTMLAASLSSEDQQNNTFIKDCITFLQDNEFVTLQKSTETEEERFLPSQLGSAVLASSMSPDEGLSVFAELRKARQCFVLENELHIIYLVTPVYTIDLGDKIDWYQFYCMWEKLTPDMKRVAELVGVQEGFLARAVQGRLPTKTAAQARAVAVHRRFYTALILHDLVHEVPLNAVANHYNCNKGQLQSLQQSAATFAGMVTVFCSRLGWHNLELILSQFQNRLTFGVQRELCDLVRLSLLNGQRARVLFNAGFHTVASLASAAPTDIEAVLRSSSPFQSNKKQENETEWEAEQRRKSRCIFLTGRKGVTEQEAALAIIEEAKSVIQLELGGLGIQWKDNQEAGDKGSTKNGEEQQEGGTDNNESSERGEESLIVKDPSVISAEFSVDSVNSQSRVNLSNHNNSSVVIGPGQGRRRIKHPKKSTKRTSLNVTGSQVLQHSVVIDPVSAVIVSPPGKAVIRSRSIPIKSQGHLKDKDKMRGLNESKSVLANNSVINVCDKTVIGLFKDSSRGQQSLDQKIIEHSEKDICLNDCVSVIVSESVKCDSSQGNVAVKDDPVIQSANVQQSEETKLKIPQHKPQKSAQNTIIVEADVHVCKIESGNMMQQGLSPKKKSPSPIKFDQIIENMSFTFDDSFRLSGLTGKEVKGHAKEDNVQVNELKLTDPEGNGSCDTDSVKVMPLVGKVVDSNEKETTARKNVTFYPQSSENRVKTVSNEDLHDHGIDRKDTENDFVDSFELDSETDIMMGDIPENKILSPIAGTRNVHKGDNLTSPPLYSEDLAGDEIVNNEERKSENICARIEVDVRERHKNDKTEQLHKTNKDMNRGITSPVMEVHGPVNDNSQQDMSQELIAASNFDDRQFGYSAEGAFESTRNEIADCSYEDLNIIPGDNARVTSPVQEKISVKPVISQSTQDFVLALEMSESFSCTTALAMEVEQSDKKYLSSDVDKKDCKPEGSEFNNSSPKPGHSGLSDSSPKSERSGIGNSIPKGGKSGLRNSSPKPEGVMQGKSVPADQQRNLNIARTCEQDNEIDRMDESFTFSMIEKVLEINSEKNPEQSTVNGNTHTEGKQSNGSSDLDNKKTVSDKPSQPASSLKSKCTSVGVNLHENTNKVLKKINKNKMSNAQTKQSMNNSHKHLSPGTLDFLNSMCESGSSMASNRTKNLQQNKTKKGTTMSTCVQNELRDAQQHNSTHRKTATTSAESTQRDHGQRGTIQVETEKKLTNRKIKSQPSECDIEDNVRITRSHRKCVNTEKSDKSKKQDTTLLNKSDDLIQNVSTGSDCLPPTPPAANSPLVSRGKPTPVKIRGITPQKGKFSQKLDLGLDTPKSSKSKEIDQNLADPPDVPYEERLPVIDPNDSGIPCTQASFTIIDVCADQRLFNTFIEEWSTKTYYSVSVACEKRSPQPVQGGGIGSKFLSAGGQVKDVVVDGMEMEGEALVVVGMAICWENRDAYYVALTKENVDCDLDDSLTPPDLDPSITIEHRLSALQSVLEQGNCGDDLVSIAMFDVKDSYCALVRSCGIAPIGRFQDPKVACWLMDPGAKEKNLHRMVTNYLPTEVPLLDGIGGGVGFGSLGMNPQNPGSGRYRATTEAVLTLHLMDYFRACLQKEGLHQAFQTVEMPSMVTLARMQLNGFGFSEMECESQQNILTAKLTELEEQAYQLAGHPFSLTSPDDIAQVLFIELQLPSNGDPTSVGQAPRKTPATRRGQRRVPFSTSKDVLEKLKRLHPLPGLVLEWRRISSALTKVVVPLQKEKVYMPRLNMHRIFCDCQVHTATGRVSMSEPNLQNIPKDFEISLPDIIRESPPVNHTGSRQNARGKGVNSHQRHFPQGPKHNVCVGNSGPSWAVSMRHAFVPFTGGVMLAADYSQLELRMIAHLSDDSKLARILNQDGDVFKMIAAQWKNVAVEQVTPKQRQQAKQVCYGMVYGIGPKALGEQLEVEENDAAVFIETFKSRYPGMRAFLRKAVSTCRDKGYVETILGRRRYLPAIKDTNPHARAHAERQAVNTTVQGSAADLVKKAMNRIDVRLSDIFPECSFAHRHKHRGSYNKSRDSRPHRPPAGGYLVLQLHDELIYEVAHTDVTRAAKIIKYEMEHAMKLSVRMPVKVKVGPSWGKLEDMEIL